jgi:hypothetical protein
LLGSLVIRLGEGEPMDIINEFSVDGVATYLSTYFGEVWLPHRTLVLLVITAITLRGIKLFRERK